MGAESLSELEEGPDGRLYGVTSMGGSANRGVAFAIQKSGSGFTVLRSFTGANGRSPSGRLVAPSDGFLYGTTALGGASDKGTIFRLSPSGTLTTLVSFNGHKRQRSLCRLGASLRRVFVWHDGAVAAPPPWARRFA